MKTCPTCKQEKDAGEFYARTPHCKECVKAKAREQYASRAKGDPRRGDWAEDGRRCTGCDTWKPWDAFAPRKGGKNGRNARCRTCTAEYVRDKRAENVDAARARDRAWAARTGHHYRKRYGISRDQRDAIEAEQGGLCAVCGNQPGKPLVVDHCHACNALRALLCRRCNTAMHALDEPGLLGKLLAYRDRHLNAGCG